MNANERQLIEMIRKGEGIDLEFKTCRNQLNRDVYATVCAFLNRHGGTILLGVTDSGDIQGIEPDAVSQIKKDFVTTINNPQKIHPPAYMAIDELAVEGNPVLRIYVPESSQVHRCNGRIYDRNEDGDLDITDHTLEVAALYQRKQAIYSENKIYPYAGLDELELDLLAKCRKIAVLRREDHPWRNMNDMELLKSAQIYQTDPETGKSGMTLAGLLLLGKRSPLLSAVPHHRTDLILRKVNLDRYDDRDFVDVNLVNSYDRIMAFVAKHLPDPFYLEGTTSISIRDAIFREVASNILIHREYTNAFPAKLIIERGQVRTENSNRPHGFGALNPETFTPFPKNPVIAAFFRQIGRADELGSGMRKMMRYGKDYGGTDPQLIEGDVFRTIVRVPEFGPAGEVAGEVTGEVTPEEVINSGLSRAHEAHDGAHDEAHEPMSEVEQRILHACLDAPQNTPELLTLLGYESRTGNFKKALSRLMDLACLEMTIPDKPRSKKQKYRLTEKGRKVLKGIEGGSE
ncbi:MAG: putative DNA binding domain-containing protein [Deltaproteobacteria bacterium]|nr:putative DNA binding domain-containing protein [Deltaproteobacteria bacterium]